jgi:hypothetical protein
VKIVVSEAIPIVSESKPMLFKNRSVWS